MTDEHDAAGVTDLSDESLGRVVHEAFVRDVLRLTGTMRPSDRQGWDDVRPSVQKGWIAIAAAHAAKVAALREERDALEAELVACDPCGLCGGCLGKAQRHEDCEPCQCGHHDDSVCLSAGLTERVAVLEAGLRDCAQEITELMAGTTLLSWSVPGARRVLGLIEPAHPTPRGEEESHGD